MEWNGKFDKEDFCIPPPSNLPTNVTNDDE